MKTSGKKFAPVFLVS